ncbi:unnamed protein product [Strongylus vulgaris]|uniref:Protein kinase domain-containing protein n=1 Tax=Strongylus vulgaris TaxID=40348 RepID=A0A3P7KBR5_STRVU|nr:unnamed protein product [Strongylus vulgaris]
MQVVSSYLANHFKTTKDEKASPFYQTWKNVGKVCTVSTQVRVGINALYGVKALHDMGFIHRDLKPANMALGASDGNHSRLLHIFDFGLAREYVVFSGQGRPKLRRPRQVVRFRQVLPIFV